MRRSKSIEEKLQRSRDDMRVIRKSLRDQENFAAAAQELRRQSGLPAPYPPIRSSKLNDPIYRDLLQSLLEDKCMISAHYFDKLVDKENELFSADLRMKKRVRDVHCLVQAVVENIKAAEKSYLALEDKELTLGLLIQTVHMIRVQDDAFHWLVKEVYAIILKIASGWEDVCSEMLSRTRFEYGVVLAEKGDDLLTEAIDQMSKSLEVCIGTMWYTNESDRNILSEDCAVTLCETLLRQAKLVSQTDPKRAADLANRAVLTMQEVGIYVNKNLFCVAKLRQSEYLIANKEYKEAFDVLNNLRNHIMANDAPRNKCEFYLWLGVCYFNLSPFSLAMRKFKLSLCLSESYTFEDLKAKALLYLGKIHAQDPATQSLARQCFIEAKSLFLTLEDFENEKLAKYLMAKLRAYQIFPNYIELMKKASCESFCYFFDLVQWKQKMIPFWNEHGELHHYEDEIRCLLEDEVGKELNVKVH